MIVNIISRNSPDNHYHESNNSFQPPARFPIANFRKFALVLRIGVPDVIVTMPTTHLFHEMMGYFNLVNTSHCHVSNSFNSTIHTHSPSSSSLHQQRLFGKKSKLSSLTRPRLTEEKYQIDHLLFLHSDDIIRLLEQNGRFLK